jgi:hypothetical protein
MTPRVAFRALAENTASRVSCSTRCVLPARYHPKPRAGPLHISCKPFSAPDSSPLDLPQHLPYASGRFISPTAAHMAQRQRQPPASQQRPCAHEVTKLPHTGQPTGRSGGAVNGGHRGCISTCVPIRARLLPVQRALHRRNHALQARPLIGVRTAHNRCDDGLCRGAQIVGSGGRGGVSGM